MKYDVKVRLAPSKGGHERTLRVEAVDKADAIAKATMKLDEEGQDRWTLVSIVSALN